MKINIEKMKRITLLKGLFSIACRDRLYFFRSLCGPSFYFIELPTTISLEEIADFEKILADFSFFHKMNSSIEFDSFVHKTANFISNSGEKVGKGFFFIYFYLIKFFLFNLFFIYYFLFLFIFNYKK